MNAKIALSFGIAGCLILGVGGCSKNKTTASTATTSSSSEVRYTADGRAYYPSDVKYTSDGRAYVTDSKGNWTYLDAPASTTRTASYSTSGVWYAADGRAYNASDVRYASDGRAYVTDSKGNMIYVDQSYQRPVSDVYKPSNDSDRAR